MVIGSLPRRGQDEWGSGEFHAPRGTRLHKGIDYACYPGTQIHSPVTGEVTKHGYPYADDPSYRYIQITDQFGGDWRFFYVKPGLMVGATVEKDSYIGYAQDIAARYYAKDASKIMKNHIHLEILVSGVEVDPVSYGK